VASGGGCVCGAGCTPCKSRRSPVGRTSGGRRYEADERPRCARRQAVPRPYPHARHSESAMFRVAVAGARSRRDRLSCVPAAASSPDRPSTGLGDAGAEHASSGDAGLTLRQTPCLRLRRTDRLAAVRCGRSPCCSARSPTTRSAPTRPDPAEPRCSDHGARLAGQAVGRRRRSCLGQAPTQAMRVFCDARHGYPNSPRARRSSSSASSSDTRAWPRFT
jgi:hypothetical protein